MAETLAVSNAPKAPEETTPTSAPVEESTPAAAAPAETTSAEAVEAPASEATPAAAAPEEAAPVESAPEAPPKDAAVATEGATAEAAPAAAAEEPKAEAKPEEAKKTPPTTALTKLFAELENIKKEADYGEMWGVELSDEEHVPSSIVLEKFLRANSKDVAKSKAQLIAALKWRKQIQPAKILAETEFDAVKYGGLGYVTVYPKTDNHEKEILTWNIYGAVKDIKSTFGNVEEFIKWRAALMELSVQELNLASATEKIPENGTDQYRMIQVHDYLNVSFLRMDPSIRAASKETIQTFSMAYPELLKEKFFVNVPLLMGWVFTAMKIFLSPDTIKKFHPLSYGSSLAGELKSFGQELPSVYGGKGTDIKEGLSVKYAAVEVAVPEAAPAEAAEAKKDAPVEAAEAQKDAPVEAAETKKDAPVEAAEDKKDAPVEAAAPIAVAEETK